MITQAERNLIAAACSLQTRPAERQEAARKVLQYLASPNPDLQGIILQALHNPLPGAPEPTTGAPGETQPLPLCWRHLLGFLATGAWVDALSLLGVAGVETGGAPLQPLPGSQDPAHPAYQAVIAAFSHEPAGAPARAEQAKLHLLRLALRSSGYLSAHQSPEAAQAARRVRVAAACLLGMRGQSDVIPVLEQIIDDTRDGQEIYWKLRAVQALGQIRSERSGPALLKALTSPDQRLHQAAQHALFELGSLVETTWLEALQHPNRHIRWHAAIGLGQIGDPVGAEILAESLCDENPEVRSAAARTLGSLDTTGHRPGTSGPIFAAPPEAEADFPRRLSQAARAVLQVLVKTPLTEPLRQAALAALHQMSSPQTQKHLQPLIQALQTDRLGFSSNAAVEAPRLAQKLLMEE